MKLIQRIIDFYRRFVRTWDDVKLERKTELVLVSQITKVKKLAADYEKKIAASDVVYTTVAQTFNSENGEKVFWPWVRSVLISDEYKFLIFTMRENVIRELSQTSDVTRIHEINGQLKMLLIIDSFLSRGLTQYDAEQKNKV